jgi:hypothetical protein
LFDLVVILSKYTNTEVFIAQVCNILISPIISNDSKCIIKIYESDYKETTRAYINYAGINVSIFSIFFYIHSWYIDQYETNIDMQ